jgi:hypothetical protein
MTHMKPLLFVVASMLLSGCVTTSTYQWGGYEEKLYAGYRDTTKMEELRLGLEAHIAEMDNTKQKVAPGLFAELGTLYLQGGDAAKARTLYARERDAWPESKGLMDALIKNIERKQVSRSELVK